jgi:non-heme chloroperoxidase
VSEDDLWGDVSTIRAPTLIVGGERDAFATRGDLEALAAAIPGARCAVYAGVAHAPNWQQPERFAAALADFVDSITPAMR